MSFFGSLVGAAPYFADVVERKRQRDRQAVMDKVAQDQAARQGRLITAQIEHLNAQTGAVRPPPMPRDPVADHAANRDYDINHPLPTKPTPDPIEVHKAERDYDINHPLPVQQSYTPVTLGGNDGEPAVVKPFNTKTGETGPTIGEAKPASGGRSAATITKAVASNQQQLAYIDKAIAAVKAYPQAFGLTRGLPFVGDMVDQRVDPKGIEARSLVANIGSLQIHDRTGAAMTAKEEPRLKPFVPGVNDTQEKILTNLEQLKAGLLETNDALQHGGSASVAPAQSQPKPTRPKQPTREQQLWDAAVAKYGRERVVREVGERPGGDE